MSHILSISRAVPANSYPQQKFTDEIAKLFPAGTYDPARLSSIHRNCRVGHRYLAHPLTDVAKKLDSFTNRNNAWIEIGLELIEKSVRDALTKAEVRADDVDHMFFVSVTGVATPSLDYRLMNRFQAYDPKKAFGPDVGSFDPQVRRTSIFGVGCVGGGTLINRATEYLQGHRNSVVVAISLELCSLTFQFGDTKIANLVATGLFGDAAATTVLCGEGYWEKKATGRGIRLAPSVSSLNSADLNPSSVPSSSSSVDDNSSPATSVASLPQIPAGPKPTLLPKVVATRGLFYYDQEELVAWQIGSHGFRILLSNEVCDTIRPRLLNDVYSFLQDTRRDAKNSSSTYVSYPKESADRLPSTAEDISSYIIHPGGPKILKTVAECFGVQVPESKTSLSETEQPLRGIEYAWKSMEDLGNCSSASVMMILEDQINTTTQQPKVEGARPSTLNFKEGDYSLLMAFGPGFSIEMSLMEWCSA